MREPDEEVAARVRARAVEAGLLEPIGSTPAALRRWWALELASMAEGALHEVLDPATVDEISARTWRRRLGRQYRTPPLRAADALGERCWLLDEGARVGTVLVGHLLGSPWLSVYSLFVEPAARGRGTATRALRLLADAAVENGLDGLGLSTAWTWQRSLRFYLSRGFWVRGWKRDVQLVLEPGSPAHRFRVDGDVATLELRRGRRLLHTLRARREGERLVIDPAPWLRGERGFDLGRQALCTFSMQLALAG